MFLQEHIVPILENAWQLLLEKVPDPSEKM
jgi:hypothetical protein